MMRDWTLHDRAGAKVAVGAAALLFAVIMACWLGTAPQAAVARTHSTPRESAVAAPVQPPTTQPKVMSSKYNVLMYRSIFSRERSRGGGDGSSGWGGQPATTTSASLASTNPSSSSQSTGPESALSLKGVALQDGEFVAFIEDASASRTLLLKQGDSIARGRVKLITLDGLDYDASGRVLHIDVGQNLEGGVAVNGSGPAPSAASPGGATPGVSAPAGSAPGGGGDDVLARMRRRRQQEGAR